MLQTMLSHHVMRSTHVTGSTDSSCYGLN